MFKILDRKVLNPTGEQRRRQLEEIEASRWVDTQIGDVDELHAEFLNKLREIRQAFSSGDRAKLKAAQITKAIYSSEEHGLNAQRPIDTQRLLDLI